MVKPKQIRLAVASWEIGRVASGFGVKVGGLGSVLEELPEELIQAAEARNVDLRIVLLSPCFAHYDRENLTEVKEALPVTLDGNSFEVQVFERRFSRKLKSIYFWDPGQLHWTNAESVYPDDPRVAFRLYSVMAQAMAGYIRNHRFQQIHCHDHHVSFLPFYLSDGELRKAPLHLTIHNATYQGTCPASGRGYEILESVGLSGSRFFHRYFDFFDHLNLLRAAMIRTHELGGRITTVSGDLEQTWGYAAELAESAEELWDRATRQKERGSPARVFVPNRFVNVFEKIPIAGITNGMSARNWPQNLPHLQADFLSEKKAAGEDLFSNPLVEAEMLARDHRYDKENLQGKERLKRLLHLEAFGEEPPSDLILLTAVGRLVEQKNFALILEVADEVFRRHSSVKLVVLASAPDGDGFGKSVEAGLLELRNRYPDRCFFDRTFNPVLSKLILAGGDFCLIPSRFEPCGLVDYEASLLGTVVIGHYVGGLAKVDHCAYLYRWLDQGDLQGEAEQFLAKIDEAVETYLHRPDEHRRLVREAMSLDAGWERAAHDYLDLYCYGRALKEWRRQKRSILKSARTKARRLTGASREFTKFYAGFEEDTLDRVLGEIIDRDT